jgi:uncharacterized protein YbgA (DUF1722 family)/uncharacterized protein YbbK (DUF523 family)
MAVSRGKASDKIRLGASTCLLGERVRYDGGHRRDPFLVETLGRFVEWVPVCPEVECGLSVPREAMHLEGDPASPRLVTIRTHVDHTDRMLVWARRRVEELAREDLCGYIFKANSPSSGMERIRVYDSNGVPRKVGVGMFARVFMERFPLLPVEDEGRLHDPGLRENFVERIFALKRYRDAMAAKGGRGALIAFHTAEKLLLMAHSPALARQMGRLVARAKDLALAELRKQYEEMLLKALALKATPPKHANVLQHMMGHLKEHLSRDEKQEMLGLVGDYRAGLVPLIVPVTLMKHYVRKYAVAYLGQQTYLAPHPAELALRNHA